MTSQILVSAEKAADLFDVSERTFHNLRHLPGFPKPVGLGPRCLRWRVAELRAFIEGQPGTEPTPEPTQLRRANKMRPRSDGDDAAYLQARMAKLPATGCALDQDGAEV